MFGGERLDVELLSHVRARNKQLDVMNHYGPTEATVGCCVYRVPEQFQSDKVPIGTPIPGVEATIRTDDHRLVGMGEVGELYIGGLALAQGYWKQQPQTEKVFIEIPDQGSGTHRWYRTGDLARQLHSGEIEYLGRSDGQIKIMGHRLELDEVAHVLRAQPRIRDAIVFLDTRSEGAKLIGAVATDDVHLCARELLRHLRSEFPSAMLPLKIVVFQGSLPVSERGKVNYTKIVTEASLVSDLGDSTLEQILTKRFCSVLDIATIRLDDDFFDLGGDSLAALELITWANQQFEVGLEIWTMFDCPTIREFASQIRTLRKT
jgi:acyl-coenzyme A synthetase/AMP-(fatty) acid ligase/acyl carrier protein